MKVRNIIMKKENLVMKVWKKPELESLRISSTAGGPIQSEEFDGPWGDNGCYFKGSLSDQTPPDGECPFDNLP